MPLFGLKNARRKITSPSLSSLVLRKTQSTGNIEDNTIMINSNHRKTTSNSDIIIIKPIQSSTDTISILRSPDQKHTTIVRPPTPPQTSLNPVIEEENDENDILLATKLRDITACDMDLLLSLETQARMDCQEEKEKKIQSKQQQIVRPSKIKFDLPITPPRSKSPDNNNNNKPQLVNHRQRRWSMPEENNDTTVKKGTTRLSRWSRLVKQQQQEEAQNNLKSKNNNNNTTQSDSSSSEEDSLLGSDDLQQDKRIVIGSKVKLFKRPLPIIGTVKYLGQVHFDTGEWLGIELDSRGNNKSIYIYIYIYVLS
jgi:hypothetical protein